MSSLLMRHMTCEVVFPKSMSRLLMGRIGWQPMPLPVLPRFLNPSNLDGMSSLLMRHMAWQVVFPESMSRLLMGRIG